MRLGLIVYGSLDTISGGFLYDRKLVQYLRAQGDQVEVISRPWLAYGRTLLDNFSAALPNRLRRAHFDLLLQDELVHPAFFCLNQRLRRRVSYPIISIVHHLLSSEARPVWQNRLYRLVERRYLSSVDGFVFVSRTTRNEVEKLVGHGRPAVLAYPGGDRLTGALTPLEIAARIAASGPLKIISVASLIPRKELHTLLTALAGLPRDGWRLTAVGNLTLDPPYVRAIRRQIEALGLTSQVSLVGTLPDADLAGLMAQSHLLVVPSSYEGLGIAYLEGMRFGLPAVATTAGAAHEIISHDRDGFLVPPKDAVALARCLGILIKDRRQLLKMSLAAQESAAGHPTWEVCGARLHRFLHQFPG